jgi:hypothetical protein
MIQAEAIDGTSHSQQGYMGDTPKRVIAGEYACFITISTVRLPALDS